jgi:hypothetical protein
MKTLTAIRRLSLTGVALLLTGTAPAQNQPKQEGANVSTTQGAGAPAPVPEPVITLSFPGGTLAQYVTAVKGSVREPINILCPEIARDVPLPEVSLRDVAVDSALKALAQVLQPEYAVDVSSIRARDGRPIYTVSVARRSGKVHAAISMAEPAEKIVMVFSLRTLIEGPPGMKESKRDANAILSAVETGLGMVDQKADGKPVLKYHADSYLLFVHARVDQVRLVQETIRAMQQDDKALAMAQGAETSGAKATPERREERPAEGGEKKK